MRHSPIQSSVERTLQPIAYRGERTPSSIALVEAQEPSGTWRPLDLRLDLHRHSPTGFEWGYAGSGPAQLALALTASRLPDTLVYTVYQRLKRDVVQYLQSSWHIDAGYLDLILVRLVAEDIAHDLAREH